MAARVRFMAGAAGVQAAQHFLFPATTYDEEATTLQLRVCWTAAPTTAIVATTIHQVAKELVEG